MAYFNIILRPMLSSVNQLHALLFLFVLLNFQISLLVYSKLCLYKYFALVSAIFLLATVLFLTICRIVCKIASGSVSENLKKSQAFLKVDSKPCLLWATLTILWKMTLYLFWTIRRLFWRTIPGPIYNL